MSTPPTNAEMWRSHLDGALGRPGETIILATLDAERGMSMQTATVRPQDLVDAARSLIDQAIDLTQKELDAEDGNDQGDDPREEQIALWQEALDLLPDPNEDQ
jgi:hypothetical protein